jgi:hypothetical protein
MSANIVSGIPPSVNTQSSPTGAAALSCGHQVANIL